MANKDEALGWDSQIEDVPKEEFQQLENGDYDFVVSSLEQDKWKQDVKYVGGFPYAKIKLAIMVNGEQVSTVTYNLTLSVKNQWRIREFFAAIGMPVESGKAFAPKWNKVEGKKGIVKLEKDEFTGRDGDKIKTNKVKGFLEQKIKADASDIPDDDDMDF